MKKINYFLFTTTRAGLTTLSLSVHPLSRVFVTKLSFSPGLLTVETASCFSGSNSCPEGLMGTILKFSRVFSKEFKINKMPSLSIFSDPSEPSIDFSNEVIKGMIDKSNSEFAYFSALAVSYTHLRAHET